MSELEPRTERGIIPAEIRSVLTEGLLDGYAGDGKVEKIQRGGFDLKTRHYETADGKGVYDDAWTKGGGQELASHADLAEKWTRTYGGQFADKEILGKLGVTKEDIEGYLKLNLRVLKDRTRLDKSCFVDADGKWRYLYVATLLPETRSVVGLEKILYGETLVFSHAFAISHI